MVIVKQSAYITPGNCADIHAHHGVMRCTGMWTLDGIEELEHRLGQIAWPSQEEISLDGSGIIAIDTIGALLLLNTLRAAASQGQTVHLRGLNPDYQALLDLVRERQAAAGEATQPSPSLGSLGKFGKESWDRAQQALGFLAFVGETAVSLARALLRPGRIRWRALLANIEDAGVNALAIVGLLSFLMGVVIAYQGGQQLKYYGANIFIVDLVSLTMLRELAPLLTAIIIAGRTGSAFTAQIGTMSVTEEIDALRTIGIPPIDLLVLPKLLALFIALPLLTVFADLLSLLGGMAMAHTLLNVSATEFIDRFPRVVSAASFLIGLGKAPVFAIIIALVGCYQGFQVKGSADSVGRQTTVSVVQAIFLVIVADACFSIVLGGFGL